MSSNGNLPLCKVSNLVWLVSYVCLIREEEEGEEEEEEEDEEFGKLLSLI